MKKIGFIGVYDKTDLILGIAKILVEAQKKVLVIDATEIQKSRYVVPVINPTKSYITEFEGIDVAVGFETLENVKQYLAIDGEDKFDYDYMLIDTDDYKGIVGFNLPDAEKLYYITSFDAYSLKKGIEVLGQIEMPLHMMKLFFSKEMLKEEEEYFDYLALGLKVIWNEEKLYFLLENGDRAAITENQRVSRIKFRNLSNEYRENVEYLVHDIEKEIDERKIKTIMKNL